MALNRVQYINSFGYKGLYTDLPPDLVPPGALITGSKNFRVNDGKLEVKHGVTRLAGPESIHSLGEYVDLEDNRTTLVFGTSKQYFESSGSLTDITNTGGFSCTVHCKGTTVYDTPSSGNVYVVASPNDIPQTWDGDTGTPSKFTDMSGIGSTFKAKHIGVLGNHLIFGNVEYSSTYYPYNVVWSDLNNIGIWPTEFGGTGTGSCGYSELYLTEGQINLIAPFQNYLLIGKKDAFILMVATGISSAPFDYQWVTRGVGTPFETFAVLPTGVGLILEDDIILYKGIDNFQSIAHGKIRNAFFDALSAESNYNRIHSCYSPTYNEWRIYINSANEDRPFRTYIYRVNENEWCYDEGGRLIYDSRNIGGTVYTIEGSAGFYYANIYYDDSTKKTDGDEATTDYIDNGDCQGTSPPILTGETTLHGWNSTTYALDSGHGTWQRTAEKAYQGDYSWKYTNTSEGTDYIYITDNYDAGDMHGLTQIGYHWLEIAIWYDALDNNTSENLKITWDGDQGEDDSVTPSVRGEWAKYYISVNTDDGGGSLDTGWKLRISVFGGSGEEQAVDEFYVGSVRLLWHSGNTANYLEADGGDIQGVAITADRTGDDIDSFDRYMHTWLHYNRTGETSDEMTVNISTDQGDNWESPHTIDLSTDETRQRDKLEWNTAGRTVRTRFTGRKFTVYGEKIGFIRQGER